MLAQRGKTLLPRFTRIIIAGDGPPTPKVSPILLWGEQDQLMGTRAQDGRKFHSATPGSQLHFIADTGHFPQLEAPELFCEQLEAYID
jgi:pimeloyl-ACP methyl ester carboxylesterase